jgi:hypothetical protein
MTRLQFLALACLFLSACAFVPKTVSRPWNRTLSDQEIPVGSVIAVSAETKSTPLLGSEALVEKKIADQATALLERRGFMVVDREPTYSLNIIYDVSTNVKEYTSTSSYSSGYAMSYQSHSGFGVILAQAVSAMMMRSVTSTQTTSIEYDVYTHLLTCEIRDQNNRIVWKCDSKVDTGNIDILGISNPLLQMALSGLPRSGEVIPRVAKLKTGRFSDYVRFYVDDRYFMCPALPNYIRMGQTLSQSNTQEPSLYGIESKKDEVALLAYLDLLETAEYAIPGKSPKNWDNITSSNLWHNVTLIGRYYLGDDQIPVNVVIHLKGTPDYYYVNSVSLVSDQEFAEYQSLHSQWIAKLEEFYDFYE